MIITTQYSNLPADVDWHIIERHDDGTVTVEVDDSYHAPALALAARLATVDKVTAGLLTDDEVTTLSPIFDSWYPGLTVEAGDVLQWDGTLVECIQEHTTQADWTPDVARSLWKIHRQEGVLGAWVQPVGSHDAYKAGDKVTHNGQTWQSTVDANTWEPGVYGWEVIE